MEVEAVAAMETPSPSTRSSGSLKCSRRRSRSSSAGISAGSSKGTSVEEDMEPCCVNQTTPPTPPESTYGSPRMNKEGESRHGEKKFARIPTNRSVKQSSMQMTSKASLRLRYLFVLPLLGLTVKQHSPLRPYSLFPVLKNSTKGWQRLPGANNSLSTNHCIRFMHQKAMPVQQNIFPRR